MAIKKTTDLKDQLYFITFTCKNHIPLFEITNGYQLIYNWFDFMKEKYGNKICGYVIMPNHLHFLLFVTDKSPNLNSLIGNGKRFLAYEFIKLLTAQKQKDILQRLADTVSEKEKARGKKHRVFEPSFDWKICLLDKFIWQKLDYIHFNPIRGKWNLAENLIDYQHSSAKFYATGEQGVCFVTDYRLIERTI